MATPRTGPLGILSATGAMLYRDANGNIAEVVPGVNGQTLTLVGGVPAWQNTSVSGIYLQAADDTDQLPGVTTPVGVTMNTTVASNGLSQVAGVVTVPENGVYFIMAGGQVGLNLNGNVNVHLWLRDGGGVDVPDSNTRAFLTEAAATFVLVCQAVIPLLAGDTIQAFQSISDTTRGAGLHHSSPVGEPEIPSMIFSMFKVGN